MTDTSQTRLAYVPEVTYGTTPATPTFKLLRFTGESFNPSVQNVSSNEIRPDRNVADITRVGVEAAGDFNFELSYGSFDDMLEGVLFSTWATNVLKNGTTQKSFTFEKTFETGATDNYHRYTGCVLNTMNLSMKARDIVTGSFGVMGNNAASAQAIVTGATYTPSNTNPVMNAANDFASLAVTGASGIKITEMNLSITNNLRQQAVIGQLGSKGIGTGRFVVTGDLTAYFDDQTLFELYLANTYTDLSFTLGGVSSKNYSFVLPKLKFTDGQVVAGGNDADVMLKIPFQAVYDTTNSASIKITRTP